MAAPVEFSGTTRRVVSLVPSLTESMFDLGLGERVIGITDYCIFPADGVAALPRLGGTKNPDANAIIALRPDLVLANQEENTPATIHALREAGIPVWLTFPKTVADTVRMLADLAAGFRSELALQKVQALERAVEWARASALERDGQRYFCPVWQDQSQDPPQWWMTFDQSTYCSDVLKLFGMENVFARRARRYPLSADLGQARTEPANGRDTRYPRVPLSEIVAAQPQAILLPSEPFAYGEEHRRAGYATFVETPAAQRGRIYLLDGTLITWCGTRLARALEQLPGIFLGNSTD
jgi:ABC-type Fe3+-hydroxamate transport system substrate-binding protein